MSDEEVLRALGVDPAYVVVDSVDVQRGPDGTAWAVTYTALIVGRALDVLNG